MKNFDLYHDPGHAFLLSIIDRVPASDFLKTAEFEDSTEGLPDSVFADPYNRLFPIHTPEHAAMSMLYAKHGSKTAAHVIGAIEEALDIFGVTKDQLELREEKTAELHEDECIFPETRTYPVRTPDEVKIAEERLLAQRSRLLPENRALAFSRLVKAAEFHGVNVTRTSMAYAGQTYTDRKKLAANLQARANVVKDPSISEKYAALARATAKDRNGVRHELDRAKLAQVIYDLDKQAALVKHYDIHVEDPILTVFNGEKMAADAIDLGNGYMVSAGQLAQLPASFYGDLFGEDILKDIAPGGDVDPSALAAVVDTFPSDMRSNLRQALASAGVKGAQT